MVIKGKRKHGPSFVVAAAPSRKPVPRKPDAAPSPERSRMPAGETDWRARRDAAFARMSRR
jgi:hypothetical protein